MLLKGAVRKNYLNVRPPKVKACSLRVHVCKCVCLPKKRENVSDVNIAI